MSVLLKEIPRMYNKIQYCTTATLSRCRNNYQQKNIHFEGKTSATHKHDPPYKTINSQRYIESQSIMNLLYLTDNTGIPESDTSKHSSTFLSFPQTSFKLSVRLTVFGKPL